MNAAFDVTRCRSRFPALARRMNDRPVVYFDGPAGSQVPQSVIDAVGRYLAETNANHEGAFATSRESDAMIAEAHRAVADLLGADDPDQVIFGANMTTMTLSLSRALSRTWNPGDEVLTTRLEHDANFTPWALAARDAGATLRCAALRPDDCTLDLEDFRRQLSDRTRFVAVCCASNAVGSVTPIREIVRMAHEVGAEVFLDAVHYAPHLLMDVGAWDCDYLACSAYKFFGPHVGVLWGKRAPMERLPVYKLRPPSDELPGRWMTGTQNHEGIAGTLAAVEYQAGLGRECAPQASDRRSSLVAAYGAIAEYERSLTARLLGRLVEVPGVKVWGITDPERLSERAPTVSFTHARCSPREVAEFLADRGIFVWHGNYYALPLTEALDLEPEGMVRIGLLHYNTADEVDYFADVLAEL